MTPSASTRPANDERTRVRREVRAARRALSQRERTERSHALCCHIARAGLLLRARRVACFWPSDGEVDLSELFPRIWRAGGEVLLPVIERGMLWFARFRPDTRLADNRFGIPEPIISRDAACPLLALDLVLVPLVAFDLQGNRIGMGGGYYDRTFARRRHRVHLRRPRLIGVGFEFQQVAAIAREAWDVPLDAVVSDSGYHRFR